MSQSPVFDKAFKVLQKIRLFGVFGMSKSEKGEEEKKKKYYYYKDKEKKAKDVKKSRSS